MQSPKPEWPCLFSAPGQKTLSFNELRTLVESTPSQRRRDLWEGFSALVGRLLDADLSGFDMWVNGSFTTTKPVPKDVDCILWVPQAHIDKCSDLQYQLLLELRNRSAVRARHGVDLYLAPPEERRNIDYWSQCFGTKYDNITPKGFAVITL